MNSVVPLQWESLELSAISSAFEIEAKLLNRSGSDGSNGNDSDLPFIEKKGRIGKRMSDVGIFPSSARRDINTSTIEKEKEKDIEHKEDAWGNTNDDDDEINSNDFLTKVKRK